MQSPLSFPLSHQATANSTTQRMLRWIQAGTFTLPTTATAECRQAASGMCGERSHGHHPMQRCHLAMRGVLLVTRLLAHAAWPDGLQKFDSSFNYILKFGSSGTGDGQVRLCLAAHCSIVIGAQARSPHRPAHAAAAFCVSPLLSGLTPQSAGTHFLLSVHFDTGQPFCCVLISLLQFQAGVGICIDASGNV